MKRNHVACASDVPPKCFCGCASLGAFIPVPVISSFIAFSAPTQSSYLIDFCDGPLREFTSFDASMALSMETQLQSIFEDVVVNRIFNNWV